MKAEQLAVAMKKLLATGGAIPMSAFILDDEYALLRIQDWLKASDEARAALRAWEEIT